MMAGGLCRRTLLLLALVSGFWWPADAARILVVMPTPSISHQTPIRAVVMQLVARGHHVTYITTDPVQDPPANLTQVDMSFSYNFWKLFSLDRDLDEVSPPDFMLAFMDLMTDLCDTQLKSSQIQNFIQSGQKFDLFVLEASMFQSYFGLYHTVGSPPLVGFVSLGMLPSGFAALGNPDIPSISPSLAADFPDRMSFIQRTFNTLGNLIYMYFFENRVLTAQEGLLRKYFGQVPPPVIETERNYSLMLVNNHFSINYPRPYLPSVIELTGLHIQKERHPLPKAVHDFLDGAGSGAVYFSLGTNVRSALLSAGRVLIIAEALSALPVHVLWKWEAESGPPLELPPHVLIAPWFPQQDVLAHPNVRVFVTQGGLQSMNEAVYFGVPTVGIPFVADQAHNVAKMVDTGIGIHLNPRNLTKESLFGAITAILQDSSYNENMQKLSKVYREHQETSLDRAVWWLEYVIRHNGAPHLRSPALNFSWWQLWMIDIFCIVIVLMVTIIFILKITIQRLLPVFIFSKKTKKQ